MTRREQRGAPGGARKREQGAVSGGGPDAARGGGPRRVAASRGVPIDFTFDDAPIAAFEGETIATALLAAGVQHFCTMPDGAARLPLCNMGTCFDCSVTVDGVHYVRACLTPAAQGIRVETERRW